MKMINFFNLSIFWGGRVHRVPSLTYHGNVFNVITGLFLIKVNPILSNKNQLFPTTIDSDFYQIENFQQIFFQLSDPTSSLPSPPTSMTSSLTSFGFTQEQVNITLSRGVTLTVDQWPWFMTMTMISKHFHEVLSLSRPISAEHTWYLSGTPGTPWV